MDDLTFREAKFSDGWLMLKVDNQPQARRVVYEMKPDIQYTARIGRTRKKRSLDANAYCWVLIDKIAAAVGTSKLEVYRSAIRDIGGNCDMVCIKQSAAETLCKAWQHNGLGWCTETIQSKLKGCVNVLLYYGSSVYDTNQMILLIDHLIQDAQALGIETLPPHDLERLKEDWSK